MARADRDRSDPRTPRARRLRQDATPFERRLWSALKQLEVPPGHFRRQSPIGPYFADFAHHGLRLVVELDGEQHGHQEGRRHDASRTAYLNAAGYRVLRFWNHEVFENLDGVVETILAALAEVPPTPNPSPPQAGGGGPEPSRVDVILAALAEAPPTPNPSPPQAGGGGSEPSRVDAINGASQC